MKKKVTAEINLIDKAFIVLSKLNLATHEVNYYPNLKNLETDTIGLMLQYGKSIGLTKKEIMAVKDISIGMLIDSNDDKIKQAREQAGYTFNRYNPISGWWPIVFDEFITYLEEAEIQIRWDDPVSDYNIKLLLKETDCYNIFQRYKELNTTKKMSSYIENLKRKKITEEQAEKIIQFFKENRAFKYYLKTKRLSIITGE